MTKYKLYFCRGCGLLLHHVPGEAVCENCTDDTTNPIVGEFEEDQAAALAEVA